MVATTIKHLKKKRMLQNWESNPSGQQCQGFNSTCVVFILKEFIAIGIFRNENNAENSILGIFMHVSTLKLGKHRNIRVHQKDEG